MARPLRVALICHFSNPEVRDKLPLSKKTVENHIRRYLNKPKNQVIDYAPWITNMISEFEKRNDIEIHIISPHRNLKKNKYSFKYGNIYYHFFRPDNDIMVIKLFRKLFKIKRPKYYFNRHLIKGFVKDINPDVVNLIGSENPYYSIAGLDITNLPLILTTQTVYTNPLIKKFMDNIDQYRWDLEIKLHKKIKYYCCTGMMYRDLVLHHHPNAVIFYYTFPKKPLEKINNVIKKYDFVFFAANVSKVKGIEDTIQALTLVKKEYPEVTLNIVGNYDINYKKYLEKMIEELELKENIKFNDYFPQHSDMLKHIQKAKYAVLPVKLDVISTTMIESLMLGLPLITYKTSGTPTLNKYGEAVLICDIDDINSLAQNMLRVMKEPELVKKMLNNSKIFIDKEYDNVAIIDRLVSIYNAVYKHYYENEPIPKELIFNPEDFPDYKKFKGYNQQL